ncbi:MAG: AI-2E family transporter [Legionella sp.]|nr:AI-2E family transporter [Legionella sp.]
MPLNRDTNDKPFILNATLSLFSVCLIGYLLIAGRSLLIPLVIAIFIWHLLNTIYNGVHHLPFVKYPLPKWLSMILSLLIVAILLKSFFDILTTNVQDVIAASSRYQQHLTNIFNYIDDRLHIKDIAKIDTFVKNLSIQHLLISIYEVFTSITSSAVLIALYVAFLFVEQHFFLQKLNALFPSVAHRQLVNNILSHIVRDTQTYLGIKTLLGLITAVASWIIMIAVGLDFAAFWAVLIFFLNFIPNIGVIIAIAFPMLLALIQFESWVPFIIISSGISAIQFIIGNLVEPRFLGKSLNLSPLVILIALSLWGAIWGVLGMFLSVPITVMMMIIFAHFKQTRPIAILLSQDGYVKKIYEPLPN